MNKGHLWVLPKPTSLMEQILCHILIYCVYIRAIVYSNCPFFSELERFQEKKSQSPTDRRSTVPSLKFSVGFSRSSRQIVHFTVEQRDVRWRFRWWDVTAFNGRAAAAAAAVVVVVVVVVAAAALIFWTVGCVFLLYPFLLVFVADEMGCQVFWQQFVGHTAMI